MADSSNTGTVQPPSAWLPSQSVSTALNALGPGSPVDAASFASRLLDTNEHRKNYAGGRFASMRLTPTSHTALPAQWLQNAQDLFSLQWPGSQPSTTGAAEFHGRLLLIGLCLLEPELYEQVQSAEGFSALVGEIKEQPFEGNLSEHGLELYKKLPAPPTGAADQVKKTPDLEDSVPSLKDDPLRRAEEDVLGRGAFARFLARRIIAAGVDKQSGVYAVHLYGPWGAGKTSLLNLLRGELASAGGWLVVDFNAWSNQHIQPPWWSLLEQVFRQTERRLRSWQRWQEYGWRFMAGRTQYWIGLAILSLVFAFGIVPQLRLQAGSQVWGLSAGAAEDISKILALIVTIWGLSQAAAQSLLLGGQQAAQSYTERTRDPAGEIKIRFETLIDRLGPRERKGRAAQGGWRVAVFIDDLDRCQSQYVVDLLEGIQTLFKGAPVVFVVAADRRWLNACYEDVYEKLEPRIHEPGKPLGTLFLEKAFRFSAPVPSMSEGVRQKYWLQLIGAHAGEAGPDPEAARVQARQEVKSAGSEAQVLEIVQGSRGRSLTEQRAIREEAAVQLAAPQVLERLEHALKPYGLLLEPNPRAIKLMVNRYSVNRALAILTELDIDRHQLILWTILASRWPQLADHLVEHPGAVNDILNRTPPKAGDEMSQLLANEDVLTVAKGGAVGLGPLTEASVRLCRSLNPG